MLAVSQHDGKSGCSISTSTRFGISFELPSTVKNTPVPDTKKQRRMLLGVLRVKVSSSASARERSQARHAVASRWLVDFAWHQRIASQQVKFHNHTLRGAWRNSWSGLTALHRDTNIHNWWQASGRLRRFFQGHVAQRWQASVDLCTLHAVDPWLILQDKSAQFKGGFDILQHNRRTMQIAETPECCACSVKHTTKQPLFLCANGHHACIGHLCVVDNKWFCVHCQQWAQQFLTSSDQRLRAQTQGQTQAGA